jgi:hypothetical protein
MMIDFCQNLYEKYKPKSFKEKLVFKIKTFCEKVLTSIFLPFFCTMVNSIFIAFSSPMTVLILSLGQLATMLLMIMVLPFLKKFNLSSINKSKQKILNELKSTQNEKLVQNVLYKFSLINVALSDKKEFDSQKYLQSCLALFEDKVIPFSTFDKLSDFIANAPQNQLKKYKPFFEMSLSELEKHTKKHVASLLEIETDPNIVKKLTNFVKDNSILEDEKNKIFKATKKLSISL